jgi:hypothetical protein
MCDYVADCLEEWRPVTNHHLLTHTSGMPDYLTTHTLAQKMATPWSPEQLITHLKDYSKSPYTFAYVRQIGFAWQGARPLPNPVGELRSPNPTNASVRPHRHTRRPQSDRRPAEPRLFGERKGYSLSSGGAGGPALLHTMGCFGLSKHCPTKSVE